MKIITKTLKYQSFTGQIDSENNPILEPVEKQVSFYEMSQTDQRQARLFFMMRPLYREVKMIGDDKSQIIADPKIMYDLTIEAINSLIIIDPKGEITGNKFTEQDKKEFMNDTFAIMAFGEWFLNNSSSFFLNYFENYLISPNIPKNTETNS